ncbi:MAG TPA: DUF294 nucleotidyltransferase-like domain-containing protein, partial [Geobacterales bacterium]|nr:DUF294 nucleotidyltransferase-like domain-containing protein [Geobacterales bacterium]
MALFLGARPEQILSYSGTVELEQNIRQLLVDRCRTLGLHEDSQLLTTLLEQLSLEKEREQQLLKQFPQLLARIDNINDPLLLAPLLEEGNRLIAEHFANRRSVLTVHRFATLLRQQIMQRAFELQRLDSDPAIALLAVGSAGRGEETLVPRLQLLLVHGGDDGEDRRAEEVGKRVAELFQRIGFILHEGGASTDSPSYRGGLIQWRQRLSISHHQEGAIDYLTLLGDAAPVAGDRALAEAMLLEVAQGTERLRSSVMALARHASLLPVALGFWGHLKTERSGEHRGEYNVAAHALGPLIASLRAYAMLRGISDRSSIA